MPDNMRQILFRVLVPVLLGLALSLSFAPFGLWMIAMVVPAILFWLWLRSEWRDAVLQGFWFGVGMFTGGLHWIYYSIHQYGGTPFEIAVLLNGLLVLFLALYPALLAWVLKTLSGRLSVVSLGLGFAVLWPVMEWLRGWLFTGFPWLSLGYSQIDAPLAGVAPVLGVYGVSMVTVLVSLSLFLPMLLRWSPYRAVLSRGGVLLSGILGITLLLVAGAGKDLHWTKPSGEPISVAVIQGNVDQGRKWSSGGRREALSRYLKMTRKQMGKDLVVWPETAVPYFYSDVEYQLALLGSEAKRAGSGILVGVPTREANGDYYNSVIGIGDVNGQYRKQHLVPFGEYVPLSDWFGPLLQFLRVPMSNFSAGKEIQGSIGNDAWALAVSVCYESVFPGVIRTTANQADLLVNVTNDGWFGGTVAPDQHLQIARMRSLEFGRGMIRAASTGISALIDEKGQVVGVVRRNQRGVLEGTVIPMGGRTPFSQYGNNWIVWLVLMVSLLVLMSDRNVMAFLR